MFGAVLNCGCVAFPTDSQANISHCMQVGAPWVLSYFSDVQGQLYWVPCSTCPIHVLRFTPAWVVPWELCSASSLQCSVNSPSKKYYSQFVSYPLCAAGAGGAVSCTTRFDVEAPAIGTIRLYPHHIRCPLPDSCTCNFHKESAQGEAAQPAALDLN